MKKILILVLLVFTSAIIYAQIRAGTGRIAITPQTPAWLTGYASRTKPSTEILHDLWAKAVVFEDKPDNRIVIVTTDILGLSREISEEVARRVGKKYGINRSQLLLTSSHTHSGPVIWPCLSIIFDLNPADQKSAAQYSQKLTDDIVSVIDMAINSLAPVQVSSGHGTVGFAMNRREPTDKGVINGLNPNGPVDHDVPVIKIASPDGKLKAVLFAYACHNTTSSTYLINGDYAGFAQIELEKANPGSMALFISGCGADQNPQPRGTLELAEQHGKSLAKAVQTVLTGELQPVRSPIRTDYSQTDLEFLPFDPGLYEKEIQSADKYVQRRAKLMLEAYNKGWNVSRLQYPVQVVRFNNDLTILALSGEVVVDYSLNVKKKFPGENLLVAGYCNEVQCYIPTAKMLKEGGYEPESSMIYYGLPGPFAENVEDKINKSIDRVMKSTGAKVIRKR
jgi:neutral ceramidase